MEPPGYSDKEYAKATSQTNGLWTHVEVLFQTCPKGKTSSEDCLGDFSCVEIFYSRMDVGKKKGWGRCLIKNI